MDSSLNVAVARRRTAYYIDSPLYLPQSVLKLNNLKTKIKTFFPVEPE
jgi:hypothetical protein